MSANEDGTRLRFEAGKFENAIVTLILIIQITLGVVAAAMLGGIVFLNRGFEILPDAFPVMIAMVVVAHLLNYLYE